MLFVLLIYHTPTHNDSANFPQMLFVAIYKNHKAFNKLLQVNVPIVLNSLDTGGNGMGGGGHWEIPPGFEPHHVIIY